MPERNVNAKELNSKTVEDHGTEAMAQPQKTNKKYLMGLLPTLFTAGPTDRICSI